MVKKILTITTWVLTAVALAALLGFARMTHYSMPVTGLELEIKHEAEGGFLIYNQVYAEITDMVGAKRTKSLRATNIRFLLQQLEQNPYVSVAEASTTLERKVKVKLIERKPFVRFYTTDNSSYYIDNKLFIFPVHSEFIARVMIANGQISPLPIPTNRAFPMQKLVNKQHNIFAVAKVAQEINRDEFMKVLVDQIFVTEENEIELSPKIGDASIILGDTNHIRDKIFNISAFFQARSNDPALNTFNSINARFKNQIVCTKRDSI